MQSRKQKKILKLAEKKFQPEMKCIYTIFILSIGLQALKADDEVTVNTVDSTEVSMMDGDKMSLDNEKVKECQKCRKTEVESYLKQNFEELKTEHGAVKIK